MLLTEPTVETEAATGVGALHGVEIHHGEEEAVVASEVLAVAAPVVVVHQVVGDIEYLIQRSIQIVTCRLK